MSIQELAQTAPVDMTPIPDEAFPVPAEDITVSKFEMQLSAASAVKAEFQAALQQSTDEVMPFHDAVSEVLRGHIELRGRLTDKMQEFDKVTGEIETLQVTYDKQVAELGTVMSDINDGINNAILAEVSAQYYRTQDAPEQKRIARLVELMHSTPTTPAEENAKMEVFEELRGVPPEKTEDDRYKTPENTEEAKRLREVEDWRRKVQAFKKLQANLEWSIEKSRDEQDNLIDRQHEIAAELDEIRNELNKYDLLSRIIPTDLHEALMAFSAPDYAGRTAVGNMNPALPEGDRDEA
jgi:chromosome segregation ATPase